MAERRFQFMSPESQRVTIEGSREHRTRHSSELRGSVQGGGAGTPVPVRPNINRQAAQFDGTTLAALQSMADAVIRPAVERKQQEMYIEGARRQIEGEALQDIVEEQPWYSRIFGPSASVQGARTMAQMRAVEDFTTELQNDMVALRSLSPDEFQAELMARIDRHSSLGDSLSNAAVQAQLLENYGPIIRNHTKEHYSWVQEQMQEQFTSALAGHARFMYSAVQGLSTGHMSEDDYRTVLGSVANALQPIEGQTADSYWSGVQVATEEAMAQGNWHFVNVVENVLYEHMPADQRVKFRNDRRKYEIQTQADMSAGEFSLEIAQLKAYSAEGLISADETWQRIGAMNQRFKAMTGLDRDLIDASSAEGIITNNLRGIIQEQRRARDKAQTALEKQLEFEREVILATQQFQLGNADAWVSQGGDRQIMQDAAWGLLETQMMREQEGSLAPGTWAATAANALNNEGFKVRQLENRIQRGARMSIGEDYNPVFEDSYQAWRELYDAPGGRSAAAAYAGNYAGQFEQYHRERESGLRDPSTAFSAVFNTEPTRNPASRERVNEIHQWLAENHTNPGIFRRFLGETPLHPSSQARLANMVADEVAKLDDRNLGLSNADAFNLGFAQAQSRADIVGQYVVPKSPSDARIRDILSVTDKEAGELFDWVVEDRLKQIGVRSPTSVEIVRSTNTAGNPIFNIMAWEDGVPRMIQVSADDLRSRIGQTRPDRRADTRTNFGPSPIPGLGQ